MPYVYHVSLIVIQSSDYQVDSFCGQIFYGFYLFAAISSNIAKRRAGKRVSPHSVFMFGGESVGGVA